MIMYSYILFKLVAPKANRSYISQSVVKQMWAAPIFTRCGRATLTPVLEYLVTEPPLKSDGTPRYAAHDCRSIDQ
jgi:hypothetical protein